MARLVKKASKKTAKKAAPAHKKTAGRKKTVASARKAPAKNVGRAAKKESKKQAPKKKSAQRVASSEKAVKQAVAPREARKPSAAPRPVEAAAPAKPPRPPKLSPAQIEELRLAKERRKAQERQADFYDKASKAFQARHFQRALTLFEKAAEGPDPTLTDRARVHVTICERQVKPRKVKLKTADEFYHYGIRLINERRLDEAGKSLNQALKRQPRGAHIHFAAAILAALTRDLAGTYKSLKRAIELDPRNRVSALNDTDLAAAARDPAIAQLLHGNGTSSGDH